MSTIETEYVLTIFGKDVRGANASNLVPSGGDMMTRYRPMVKQTKRPPNKEAGSKPL